MKCSKYHHHQLDRSKISFHFLHFLSVARVVVSLREADDTELHCEWFTPVDAGQMRGENEERGRQENKRWQQKLSSFASDRTLIASYLDNDLQPPTLFLVTTLGRQPAQSVVPCSSASRSISARRPGGNRNLSGRRRRKKQEGWRSLRMEWEEQEQEE